MGDLRLRWTGAADAELGDRPPGGRALRTTLTVPEGAHHDLILEIGDSALGAEPPDPDVSWRSTETAWRQAMPQLRNTIAPRDARHAYAVLRGLTTSDGGMVAATTMGLPERAAQGRNYDYRYVWIRDQCYAGQAVAADGPHPLLDDAVRFVHPSGRWQRAPDDPRVDGALLLASIRGAVPATDPRTLATLRAVRHELAAEGFVYRFRHDARPLGDAEGAFGLCGFLMALATRQQGDTVAAARWFERNRAACGPPGLYSEEYDVAQRQLRGNLPQGFVHALMLETSIRLATGWPADGHPAPRGTNQ